MNHDHGFDQIEVEKLAIQILENADGCPGCALKLVQDIAEVLVGIDVRSDTGTDSQVTASYILCGDGDELH